MKTNDLLQMEDNNRSPSIRFDLAMGALVYALTIIGVIVAF